MGIRSDLQSLYNLPLLDNEGGSRLISYLKKSFISASGLALRLINILVTILRFALAVLNLNLASPFLRSDGGLFVNVFRLCLLNGFDKGRDQCSNLSSIAPGRSEETSQYPLYYRDSLQWPDPLFHEHPVILALFLLCPWD